MVVKEGSNVTLKCSATGSPPPTITFRREDGEPIKLPGGNEGSYNISVYLFVSVCECVCMCYISKAIGLRLKAKLTRRGDKIERKNT